MSPRPEILIFVHHYLPGVRAGGPVRSVANMVHWLGEDITFKILTDICDLGSSEAYPNIKPKEWYLVDKALVRYLSRQEQNLKNLSCLFQEISYDSLYINGIFASSTIKTLLLKRFHQLPSRPLILAPRGQLNRGALSLKPAKKRFFLRFARLLGLYDGLIWHVSNDAEKNDVFRELRVRDIDRFRIAPNLPPVDLATQETQTQRKAPGKAHLVFLSRISPKKNLLYALQLLKDIRGDIQFDIYGPIEDLSYWNTCQTTIKQLPENVAVYYRGEVGFEQVQEILSRYHLFLFPTLGENFGHVILEALLAGCPVLISDQTPWTDLNKFGAGWAYSLNTPISFQNALQHVVDMSQAEFSALQSRACSYAHRYISDTDLIAQTKALFLETLTP